MKVKKYKGGWKGDARVPHPPYRIRKQFSAQNKAEAIVLFKKYIESQNPTNNQINSNKLKLKKGLELYYNRCSKKKSQDSRRIDVLCFKMLLKVVGDFLIHDITAFHLGGLDEYTLKKQWKYSTINRRYVTVKNIFNWFHQQGLHHKNVGSSLKMHRKTQSREARLLTTKELDTLYRNANPVLALQIKIGAYTGMRRGEIAQLNWSQIDFLKNKIKVGGTRDFSTKSGQSKTVFISNDLCLELKKYKLQSKGDWLFPNIENNGPIEAERITRSFMRLKKRISMKDVTFHDLRATCATLLAEQGMGDAVIAKQLGHSTVTMARKYSNKISDEVMQKANLRLTEKLKNVL